jgi:hypothetical protein
VGIEQVLGAGALSSWCQLWPGAAATLEQIGLSSEHALIVWRVICFAGPVLLAPVVMWVLRPMFAVFLREGCDLFSHGALEKDLSRDIGGYLAFVNVVIFTIAYEAALACRVLDGPFCVEMLSVVVGVAVALAWTIRMSSKLVGVSGQSGVLLGLVAFGGGNLPLIVVVPLLMLI